MFDNFVFFNFFFQTLFFLFEIMIMLNLCVFKQRHIQSNRIKSNFSFLDSFSKKKNIFEKF